MPSMNKLSTYKTTWEHEAATYNNDRSIRTEERGSVTYTNTRIVAWEGDIITLNSGGWQTVTTKRKMCQASTQFALRFTVRQRKGEWFVDVRTGRHSIGGVSQPVFITLPFKDGMRFNKYTGQVL